MLDDVSDTHKSHKLARKTWENIQGDQDQGVGVGFGLLSLPHQK